MKTIKIQFSGMDGQFDPEKNFIVDVLKKRYIVQISDSPDFLFYSVKSKDYLNYNCVRIFYTAENLVPDFNICDYGIGFHYIQFGDRYFRFPLYLVDGFIAYDKDDYASDLQLALHKHEKANEALLEKTDFCAFVYSNGKAAKCREDLFMKLSQYKQVNSGGRYMNNVGGPVNSKLEFQKKHKFVIAFENTSMPGYSTEKLMQAFSAGTIPIYWGDPEITKAFNSKAFINCHDYGLKPDGDNTEAFEKIIERIKELDNNEQAYLEVLSQPAFADSFVPAIEKENFEEFLFNIFDQSPQEAFRRNRYYWGERYERKQKIGNVFYWKMRKLIPIRDGIKTILKKH